MKSVFKIFLPHEILFNLFLLIVAFRLYVHIGISCMTLIYFLLPISLLFYAYIFRNSWKLRLIIYYVIMNILFQALGYVSPIINPQGKMDLMLQNIDTIIFGGNLSIMLEPYMNYWLTEFLAICYMLFMIQLPVACFIYLFKETKIAISFYVGLFSLYAFGFLGYIFVPAVGPYFAMSDIFEPIKAGFFMNFLNYMYPKGTNYTDVFPSLHCAVSCFILLFDFKYNKIRFMLYLIPCIGLWFSTVYLRYHYCIDCLCGFILAFAMLILSQQYLRLKGETLK